MGLKDGWKLCLAAGLSLTCMFAATPPIGVASALGTFTVNDAKVEGNANLFEGARIATTSASSRVYLQSGTMLTLGTNSSAKFYRDHLLLEKGAARLEGMNHYAIETSAYRVNSAEPMSEAVVRLADGELQVAALTGSLNVLNAHGALLSRVTAGTASAFSPRDDAGTANPEPQAQSGATAGTAEEAARKRRKQKEMLFLMLGTAMAGLGLAVDAILQPGPASPSPTSP